MESLVARVIPACGDGSLEGLACSHRGGSVNTELRLESGGTYHNSCPYSSMP